MSMENLASPESVPQENLPGGFETDFTFESDLKAPVEAMDRVERCLDELGWPKEEADPFLNAVEEAVTNAVVHNNLGIRHEEGEDLEVYTERIRNAAQGPDGKKKIELGIVVQMNEVVVRIKDEGQYVMEVEGHADPTTGERIFLPHGRGQFLIFNGCDEVMSYPGEMVLIKRRGGRDVSLNASIDASPDVPEISAGASG